MRRFAPLRSHMRGEVHPGVVVAGLVIALGLAWWFASGSRTSGDRREAAGDPGASTESGVPVGGPSVEARPRGDDSSAGTGKPLYRWKDDSGVLQFTDVPPANQPYTEVDVNPDRNVVTFPSPEEP